MQPWLDAGADGFGLGGGLYQPGQSAADTARQSPRLRRRPEAVRPIRIAILGYGKIAEDQHVPVDRGQPAFRARRDIEPAGPRPAAGLHRLARADPQGRRARSGGDHHAARPALRDRARVHPRRAPLPARKAADRGPCPDRRPRCLAEAQGVSLFTTWHAQHHSTVDAAAKALAGKRIAAMEILWHEDVHKWHPGQNWIWEPGGFGVFDPGINAFSIATKIFPAACSCSPPISAFRRMRRLRLPPM